MGEPMHAPMHTGEQVLELVLQLVARLDHLGLDGEIRLQLRLNGGTIHVSGKSARALEREA